MKLPVPKCLSNVHFPVVAYTESATLSYVCMKDYKHATLCHLAPWKIACLCPATSQKTPCFTAPLRWDSNCLELKQDLPSALLSPFVTGSCSVTSGWEAGKEKNTLEVTCCSHLPAPVIPERSVCLWRRAASHWVLSLPVSHPSHPYLFS